jgi:HD-GYP domain-containing protein (c-di-GMP phosphodiesterase class II)
MQVGSDDGCRWRARPFQAVSLRTGIFVIPAVVAVGTAAAVAPVLPAATSMSQLVTFWFVLCAMAAVPLLMTDRLLKLLLPLTSLLRMPMLFPTSAPPRLRVARRAAGLRNLQSCTEEARRRGLHEQPPEAAERILTLVTALNHHDPRTRGHSERVHVLTDLLAAELGIGREDRDKLRWAALVHDVGKVEIDAQLLNKPARPDADEMEALRRHPIEGARFCIPLRSWLGDWALSIEQHHERWDGGGYPYGLAGEQIALGARIVAVADAYDSMTSARPYRRARSPRAARAELARNAGTQFDPEIVEAFLELPVWRMRLAAGPSSWLAQWPIAQRLPRLGQASAKSVVTVAGALALAAGGWIEPGAPSFAVWRGEPVQVMTQEEVDEGTAAGAEAEEGY